MNTTTILAIMIAILAPFAISLGRRQYRVNQELERQRRVELELERYQRELQEGWSRVPGWRCPAVPPRLAADVAVYVWPDVGKDVILVYPAFEDAGIMLAKKVTVWRN